IYEKLKAQENNTTWDIDVAVIHQKIGGVMAREGMLESYREKISTSKLVTRDTASNALGNDVGGYVMPMFHSQTAIAYNPALVPNPPKSYEELDAWARKNPKAFGYNGIKGGMSGVSFVVGWVYAFSPGAGQLMTGPFDP
ncbi:extracellular solute-binding protein, partial [Vibrio parahaemolyticus]